MEHKSEVAKRLLQVANELADLARSMLAGEVEATFPVEAMKRLESGFCLNCERTKEEISSIKRGLCQACYQKTQRKLAANPLKESELIAGGLLTPRNFQVEQDKIDQIFTPPAAPSQRKVAKSGRRKRG